MNTNHSNWTNFYSQQVNWATIPNPPKNFVGFDYWGQPCSLTVWETFEDSEKIKMIIRAVLSEIKQNSADPTQLNTLVQKLYSKSKETTDGRLLVGLCQQCLNLNQQESQEKPIVVTCENEKLVISGLDKLGLMKDSEFFRRLFTGFDPKNEPADVEMSQIHSDELKLLIDHWFGRVDAEKLTFEDLAPLFINREKYGLKDPKYSDQRELFRPIEKIIKNANTEDSLTRKAILEFAQEFAKHDTFIGHRNRLASYLIPLFAIETAHTPNLENNPYLLVMSELIKNFTPSLILRNFDVKLNEQQLAAIIKTFANIVSIIWDKNCSIPAAALLGRFPNLKEVVTETLEK